MQPWDYKSSNKGNLTKHVESLHEGIKHYCKQCDYKAFRRSSLTLDVETIHEGIKYDCELCEHKPTNKPNTKIYNLIGSYMYFYVVYSAVPPFFPFLL